MQRAHPVGYLTENWAAGGQVKSVICNSNPEVWTTVAPKEK
jgi:hypothetical protein